MRKVRLGRRPDNLEARCFRPNTFERSSRLADAPILIIESAAEGLRTLLGVADSFAQRVERAYTLVEPRLGGDNAVLELGLSHSRSPEILPAGSEPGLELRAGIL